MSGWETSDIFWFSLVCAVGLLVGWFVTLFISHYAKVKAEMEAELNAPAPVEHAALKNLPPSMLETGQVKFTHHSIEEIGIHDGKPIYKFFVDDHGIYWVFDGVAEPRQYYQAPTDPVVRVFIGKCLYTPTETKQIA